MEKPCCFRCRDSSDINGAEFCNNPSCKCHLPKEKDDFFAALDEMKDVHIPINLSDEETGPSSTNPYSQPPAPEKKWEERFDKEAKKHGIGGLARIFYKSFTRQLLEEKAVEVEGLRKEPTLCGKCNLNGKLCKECYANRRANSTLLEAAAILRR